MESVDQNATMAGNMKFLTALMLLLIAISLLSYAINGFFNTHPALSIIFSIQCLNTLGYYALLGVGFGLPLILLASILGWLQLILLVTGNIDPHLAEKGFLNVLHYLFSKI